MTFHTFFIRLGIRFSDDYKYAPLSYEGRQSYFISTYQYQFDTHNNWIERIDYENGDLLLFSLNTADIISSRIDRIIAQAHIGKTILSSAA